jgi:hypothetical protein
MPKHVFPFVCPCCGKELELDTRSGHVRAAKVEDARGGKGLDDLLADQKAEGKRLHGAFSSAADEQRRQKDTLEDLFSDAKERAKKDKDRRPLNPFDLD